MYLVSALHISIKFWVRASFIWQARLIPFAFRSRGINFPLYSFLAEAAAVKKKKKKRKRRKEREGKSAKTMHRTARLE